MPWSVAWMLPMADDKRTVHLVPRTPSGDAPRAAVCGAKTRSGWATWDGPRCGACEAELARVTEEMHRLLYLSTALRA